MGSIAICLLFPAAAYGTEVLDEQRSSSITSVVGHEPLPQPSTKAAQPFPSLRPRWDAHSKELLVDETLVRKFKTLAVNQEAILNAFEKEGWPPKIDDPIPPTAGIDSKIRLHDTINSLNRRQKTPLIRFRGDGTGTGILWEPATPTEKIENEGGEKIPANHLEHLPAVHWDPQRRRLTILGQIVKEFKVPAPNQEAILNALEEENWPPKIDDPIPHTADIDSKKRLRDTIKCLNRKQKAPLIRFRNNGTATRVLWQLAGPKGASENKQANDLPPIHWDPQQRRLTILGKTVKEFRNPAPNQEVVLNALQEEGWPRGGIDDPIPPSFDMTPKARLAATINTLNRTQKVRLIRFRRGTLGTRVLWELVGVTGKTTAGRRGSCCRR